MGDLNLGQDQSQVFHRARSPETAVADQASRLVVPFAINKVDRIFQRSQMLRGYIPA